MGYKPRGEANMSLHVHVADSDGQDMSAAQTEAVAAHDSNRQTLPCIVMSQSRLARERSRRVRVLVH